MWKERWPEESSERMFRRETEITEQVEQDSQLKVSNEEFPSKVSLKWKLALDFGIGYGSNTTNRSAHMEVRIM